MVRELTAEHPIVDLRVLKDRTFATGTAIMTMLGFVLYASLMLLPIFLQTLLGYPALQSGLALSPRGLGSLVMMPIVGTTDQPLRSAQAHCRRLGGRRLDHVQPLASQPQRRILGHLLAASHPGWSAWPFLFIPLMATSMSGIRERRWATPPASTT